MKNLSLLLLLAVCLVLCQAQQYQYSYGGIFGSYTFNPSFSQSGQPLFSDFQLNIPAISDGTYYVIVEFYTYDPYCYYYYGYSCVADRIISPAAPSGMYLYEYRDNYYAYSYTEIVGYTYLSAGDGYSQIRNWVLSTQYQVLDSSTTPKYIELFVEVYDPNFNWYIYWYGEDYIYPQPTAQCGNGVVETGEDCEIGPSWPCCSSSCTFASSGTVCRAAIAECDEPEVCSGSSYSCPNDVYSPSTKSCGENVGFCDARIPNQCLGNSPYCHGIPFVKVDVAVVPLDYTASWENFNVISFNNFASSSGGEIEGRLAVKGNLNLVGGGWTIGRSIDTRGGVGKDNYLPYSLLVGHDVTWNSGSLLPDGTGVVRKEGAVVLGSWTTTPSYLSDRQIFHGGDVTNSTASFTAAQSFFSRVQGLFSASASNTVVVPKWGGLSVTCNSPFDQYYYLDINGADLSSSTWWNLANCNFQSYYILNIRGSGSVTVQGADFPTITERVVYNFIGSGRTLSIPSGLNGNILAPYNTITQTSGVTRGLVVAGDVTAFLHAQNPNCKKFNSVVITVKSSSAASGGLKRQTQSSINVYGFSLLSIGDTVTIGSEQVVVVGAQQDGGQSILIVSPGLTGSYPKNTDITTTVQDPSNSSRNPIQPTVISHEDTNQPSNSNNDDSLNAGAVSSSVAMYLIVSAILASLVF